jgi:hypothetical protein
LSQKGFSKVATLGAEAFLAQFDAAVSSEKEPDRPVRVVDTDGNEYDISQVLASTQHGGEVRIIVEWKSE